MNNNAEVTQQWHVDEGCNTAEHRRRIAKGNAERRWPVNAAKQTQNKSGRKSELSTKTMPYRPKHCNTSSLYSLRRNYNMCLPPLPTLLLSFYYRTHLSTSHPFSPPPCLIWSNTSQVSLCWLTSRNCSSSFFIKLTYKIIHSSSSLSQWWS